MAGKDRYKKSPKIAEKQEKAKPEKAKDSKAAPEDKGGKSDAPAKEEKTDMGNKAGPKPSVDAGDESVPTSMDTQTRQGEERKDMSARQAREMKDMHARHADEHARMGKRHEKEMSGAAPSDAGESGEDMGGEE